MTVSFQPESFLILVVEDDRLTRTLLCKSLLQEGYRVVEASDGEECIAVYEQTQPNLVLLDAMMPTVNGFECCSRLLALPGAAQIPIIMITGLDDQASVDWAFDAGATDYVTKPVHWPILRRRVRNLIEKGFFYRELELANNTLQQLAITDKLTGLVNRRCFDESLDREWKRSIRDQSSLSLILCDIDYFKAYNDIYGHIAGDRCIQQVAMALGRGVKRTTDVVARYGGEEFAVILPNTGLSAAMQVARELQSHVKSLAIPHVQGNTQGTIPGGVTISLGVASVVADWELLPSMLIEYADRALYQAKQGGRNMIVSYQTYASRQMTLSDSMAAMTDSPL